MVNFLFRVIEIFESWANGRDLSEIEIFEASSLLGGPTRKLEVFLSRYRSVIGDIIEERCSDTGQGRMCIYSWSRRAFKRYFPVAIDSGGTIIWFRTDGSLSLVAYPLHRALDLGVRGVEIPGEPPSIVTPRIDGWQVNLYWDPVLSKWMFATRYVLHNMVFVRGELKIEDYGLTINPVVLVAESIASKINLYSRLEGLSGWTFTLMIEGSEGASVIKGPPPLDNIESYRLVLIAARKPDGELLDPISSTNIAKIIGVDCIADRIIQLRADIIDYAKFNISHPSLFLWYLGRGDKEHPEIFEVKSDVYNDYINATKSLDGKSYILLLTLSHQEIVSKLRERLGDKIIDETLSVVSDLREVLSLTLEDKEKRDILRRILRMKRFKEDALTSISKALEEGKVDRALRIIALTVSEGWRVDDIPLVFENLVRDIKDYIMRT
ncbi:MAG: hypothetical protein QXV15_02170 [Acidilobaceae archaeon]